MCVVIALTETGHRWVKYWRLGFEVLVGYLNGYPFLDFKKEGRARDTDLGIINIERVIYPMDIDLGEKEKWVGLGWVRGTRLESWPFIVFKWTGRYRRFSRGWSVEAQREKGESQESGYRQLCEELQRSQVRGGVKKTCPGLEQGCRYQLTGQRGWLVLDKVMTDGAYDFKKLDWESEES